MELINFLEAPYEAQFNTLNWRNSKHVSEFFQIKHISEETHKKWLDKLKEKEPKTIAFFIRVDGRDIGVTYFHSIDYEKKEADWGIYIYEQGLRGKGLGAEALKKCLRYAKDELTLKKIFLEVLGGNIIAKKVYEKLGFEFETTINKDFLRYKRDL